VNGAGKTIGALPKGHKLPALNTEITNLARMGSRACAMTQLSCAKEMLQAHSHPELHKSIISQDMTKDMAQRSRQTYRYIRGCTLLGAVTKLQATKPVTMTED